MQKWPRWTGWSEVIDMTKATKIIVITVGLLGVASLFAFSAKARSSAKKAVGKIIDIGDTSATTPSGGDLAQGSEDIQHILQLQQMLNELHAAVQYINKNCSMSWALYPGNPLQVNGVFDMATEKMLQFYLNRQTIDLDYLNEIRNKLNQYQSGDKCKYPLSY